MSSDFIYKIYPSIEEIPKIFPNWQYDKYTYRTFDFVSYHNSELETGNYTIGDLEEIIKSLGKRIAYKDYSNLDDMLEAIKIYATILTKMDGADCVNIVYRIDLFD